MELELSHIPLQIPFGLKELLSKFLIFRSPYRTQGLDNAVKVSLLHGEDSTDKVAKIVSQVRVYAIDQSLQRKGRILAKDHLAQKKVAKGIHPVALLHLQGAHDISQTLRHLAGVHHPIAVHVQTLINRQTRSHEHRRPINRMGFEDVFGDQVIGLGPKGFKEFLSPKLQGTDVINESIEPNIGHLV